MRISLTQKNANVGDKMTKTFFAWLPIIALNNSGQRELRWLEHITVEKEYIHEGGFINSNEWHEVKYWKTIKFID
jgi:hypothetical protein